MSVGKHLSPWFAPFAICHYHHRDLCRCCCHHCLNHHTASGPHGTAYLPTLGVPPRLQDHVLTVVCVSIKLQTQMSSSASITTSSFHRVLQKHDGKAGPCALGSCRMSRITEHWCGHHNMCRMMGSWFGPLVELLIQPPVFTKKASKAVSLSF